jgi:hypothetical protein
MKKILMAAVAFAAISATPAMAATFTVGGTVAATCGALSNGSITFTGGILTSATTGALTPSQSASSSSQAAFCNGVNSTMAISGATMTTAAAAADANGFTRTLGFTPEVSFDGTVFSGVNASHALGARSGAMIVSAKDLTAAALPYAGDYTGTITVTLTPGV